jgi:hypothetical protein
MFQFLRKLFTSTPIEQAPTTPDTAFAVTFDEWGFYLAEHGTPQSQMAWSDIDLVAINIEDDFLPFPYWYVGNPTTLLRISNDAVGGKELFFDGFSQHLNGYRADATFETIIAASTAMEGSFVVWKASEHPAA